MRTTKVINGIEGDDIPYHLNLLGVSLENINDIFFVSLNDHYGLHTNNWVDRTQLEANKYKRVVFYDLINTGDGYHKNFCEFIEQFDHPNKIYLTNNFSKTFVLPGVHIVRWDFMWNRVKLYYTGANELTGAYSDPLLHHFAGKSKYILNDISSSLSREKIFLNLCGRGYGYRNRLYSELEQYSHMGYRSMRSAGIHLDETPVNGAYVPIPNKYYNNSYVSIYVESNSIEPNLIHITEKTFEPLIKGHFVVPFANPGTIARIHELGFMLPDFIDYSYDTVLDVEKRFNCFKNTIDKIINLDWATLYKKNYHIIEHNRQRLYELEYDRSIIGIFNE